ncbi:uncharacterized protein [Channa argus]|uniref:uncharacterized protein isoform X3 n=1 Tax=Channa argus TaxID=215402 RepID=UPI00351FCB73
MTSLDECHRLNPAAGAAHSSSTTTTTGRLERKKEKTEKKYRELNDPDCATFKVGDLEYTTYKDDDDELYEWGNFYLAEAVKMQVIGVVKGALLQCEQLVLMACEDTQVYGFDGEELHLVAKNLDSVAPINEVKIKYPGFKTYYRGEAFKHKTKQDWAEVKKSDVGRRLDEEHCKLVAENKSELLKNLIIIKANLGSSQHLLFGKNQ